MAVARVAEPLDWTARRRSREKGVGIPLLLAPMAALLLSFFGVIGFLIARSFSGADGGEAPTLANYAQLFSSGFFISKVSLSMRLAIYATLGCLAIGYPVAYYMSVTTPTRRRLIVLLLVLLFFSDYIMRMYALLLLLGANGLVNQVLVALGLGPARILRTEFGVVIGLIAGQVPFMIFSIFAVLRRIRQSLPQAALLLGATPLRAVLSVVVPLSASGALAGAIIVFLLCFNSYITPALLGGGFVDMIANEIFDQAISTFRIPLAAASASVLLVISLAILAAVSLVSARFLPAVGD